MLKRKTVGEVRFYSIYVIYLCFRGITLFLKYRISGYFGVGKLWRICSEIGIGNFGAS